MNTFKNKNTEIFYIVSLQYLRGAFNSKDKTTSNMIIMYVMDHEFVCRLIDWRWEMLRNIFWKSEKKNAAEKLSEVDFKGLSRH